MFKNIQNYLLLRHPLLWNVKLVPMLAVSVIINILFFVGGYINGAIDFTEFRNERDFLEETTIFVGFFSFILSLLLFIIWLVYYLRNNASKNFYPKSNVSLYKEWLFIFIICFFNCGYLLSFLGGQEVRIKSYYSIEEVHKRLDILSKASMFAEGTYHLDADTLVNGEDIHRDFFTFGGKKYNYGSIINKNTYSFSLQDNIQDSLNRVTVQQWLASNKKDSVYRVLEKFQTIAAEHHLKSNITAQQWLDKVYNYPDYTKYIVIGGNDFAPVYGYDNLDDDDNYDENYRFKEDGQRIDSASNNKIVENGKIIFNPKYYVALDQLQYAYGKISGAWTNSPLEIGLLFVILYISIGLSMLIFSFRVTSGKDWLIALVSFGITAIVTGVISAVITSYFFDDMLLIDNEYFFLTIWVVIVILLLAYFIYIKKKNLSKGISAIILNHLLWLLPALLPVVFAIAFDVSEEFNVHIYKGDDYTVIYNPVYLFLKDCGMYLLSVSTLLIFIYMYFFTVTIKKWKGFAEA